MELSLSKPQMLRKPLMLKDYLLDDLSSCSSSGFRTYPRKQCCTTLRLLLEIDLKNKPPKYIKKQPLKNPSRKPAPSALQRASTAVINAVKHLPFAAVKPSNSCNKLKLALLPRSLSRKLLKRSFWKRNDRKEIQRWEPFNQLVAQKKSMASDFTVGPTTGDSNSSTSESNRKSYSWSGSDFTASDDSTSGNSEVKISNEIGNDVVFVENKNDNNNYKRLPKEKVVSSSKRAGVIVGGGDSIDATTSSNSSTSSTNIKQKQWSSEDEKEQFSPVSVLDCPFDDDDEVSSPFQHRLARMEGTKKRLMKKIKRFERLTLTHLEPVNLEKRIALSEFDRDSNESPQHHSSESVHEDFILDNEEDENQAEDKAFNLLQLMKATMPSVSMKLKADHDNLLLDFFKEGMEMDKNSSPEHATELITRGVKLDNEPLNVANDWIMGRFQEFFLEWEVQKNRQAYIRDMEREGAWRNLNEETKEVALDLEVEVFASLINELLHDIISS